MFFIILNDCYHCTSFI